ncbi:type II toxin-antitoxin system CcdA family antitoxin [Archaeoglobus sp.]
MVNKEPTSVISVRVGRDIKEEAKKLGIDIRAIVERTLEEEVRKTKVKKLEKLVEEALNSIEFTAGEWVRVIKDARAER